MLYVLHFFSAFQKIPFLIFFSPRLRQACGTTDRQIFGLTDVNDLFKLYLKVRLHVRLQWVITSTGGPKILTNCSAKWLKKGMLTQKL
jgi:hypothetical protein